jgi:hypothetical protein
MKYFRLIHIIWIAFGITFFLLKEYNMVKMIFITIVLTEFGLFCIKKELNL